MFAPKCAGCNRAIMENYISALNSQFHPDCFVCRVSLPIFSTEFNFLHFLRHLISLSDSHSNDLFRIVKKPCLESHSTQWKASQSVQDALVLTKTNKWHPQQCLCSAPVVSPNSKFLFHMTPRDFTPNLNQKDVINYFESFNEHFIILIIRVFNFN